MPLAQPEALTAGTLLARALSVWWSEVIRFAVVSLVAVVPAFLALLPVVIAVTAAELGLGIPPVGFELLSVAVIPLLALSFAIEAAGVVAGAVQRLGGAPVGVRAMLATGLRTSMPVAVVAVLSCALVLLGLVLLVAPGLIAASAVAVALPIVVVERVGPVAAIRRSFELTRGHRASVLGALAMTFAGVVLANEVAGRLLPAFLPAAAGTAVAVLGFVVSLAVASLPAVVSAVAYQALRKTKDGAAGPDLARA